MENRSLLCGCDLRGGKFCDAHAPKRDAKPTFIARRSQLERKAPHGSPCTRCGLCCEATTCKLGAKLFNQNHGPCPALRYDSEGSRCDVADNPQRYNPVASDLYGHDLLKISVELLIGSGIGCDARFNNEPINFAFRQRLVELDRVLENVVTKSRQIWGI
jgi:hypothetical protein